jgi:hypothetical protein
LQHPRSRHRKDRQARQELVDDALVHLAVAIGVELGVRSEPEPVDRLAREIAGRNRLGLALNGLLVDRSRRIKTRRLVRLGEKVLLILEQHLGDAGVARANDQHEN